MASFTRMLAAALITCKYAASAITSLRYTTGEKFVRLSIFSSTSVTCWARNAQITPLCRILTLAHLFAQLSAIFLCQKVERLHGLQRCYLRPHQANFQNMKKFLIERVRVEDE